MTTAFKNVLESGNDVSDGRLVAQSMRNMSFSGYHGEVIIDENGEIVSYFTLLDYSPEQDALVPVMEWSQKTNDIVESMANIDWPNGIAIPPDVCAFEVCTDSGKIR